MDDRILVFVILFLLLILIWFFILTLSYDDPVKLNEIMILNKDIENLRINDNEFPFDIYVINLERDKDRWENVQNEMKKVGIENYHRWDAIDGKKIDNSVLNKHGISDELIYRSKNVGSCAASHISLLKHISDNNLGWTMIMEDDIHFHPNFKSLFPKYWNETPANAIIVYAGYNDHGANFKNSKQVFAYGTSCMHAYLVNSYGARYLLQLLNEVNKPFDVTIMFHFRNFGNTNKSFCFNGDISIDGIIPHDYKNKNRDKCVFGGIVYQNRMEIKSHLR